MEGLPAARPMGGLPGGARMRSRRPSKLTDKGLRAKRQGDADAAAARAAGGGAKKSEENGYMNQ